MSVITTMGVKMTASEMKSVIAGLSLDQQGHTSLVDHLATEMIAHNDSEYTADRINTVKTRLRRQSYEDMYDTAIDWAREQDKLSDFQDWVNQWAGSRNLGIEPVVAAEA